MEQPFDFAHPPPFAPWQYFAVAVLTVAVGSGAIVNSFLSFVMLRNRSTFSSNVNIQLTTVLNLADCITPSILVGFQAAKLVYGSYGLGFWGCQAKGLLISVGVNWSLFAVVLIAVERYCVVVRDIRKPWQFWRWPVLVAGVFGATLASMSVLGLDAPYVVQPSGVYCMDDLYNVPEVSRGNQILYLAIFPTLLATVSTAYFRIYHHVSTITQQTKRAFKQGAAVALTLRSNPVLSSAPTFPVPSAEDARHSSSLEENDLKNGAVRGSLVTMLQKVRSHRSLAAASRAPGPPSMTPERQAFKTSVGITACFFLMLTPYLVNLSLVTASIKPPQWLDVMVALCGVTNLMSDAVVLYSLNPHVRKLVDDQLKRLFRLS
ncbi:hypothetical protein RI367_007908 [Sorochytrium milnesiophthora]